MSIRSKLILLMLALLASVSAVMALLFHDNEWNSISANSQKKNLQILLAMSEVCREASISPNKAYAYKYFKSFLKTPEIIQVYCTDLKGRKFMEDRYYSPQPSPFSRRFTTFPPPSTGRWETRSENGVEIMRASVKDWGAGKEPVVASVDFSTQLIYQEMNDSLKQSSSFFFAILSVAFALGCAGILVITRVIAAPMQAMVLAVRQIGSGSLKHRIPADSGDELGTLAAEFNDMADRLAESDEIKKDFFSSVTHDLRSPVTGIELCTDIIQELAKKGDYAKIPEQTAAINDHAQRLNRYIDSLLEVSRIESGKLELDLKTVNLEELADRAVRAFKAYAAQKGLKLELVVAGELGNTEGDPERLYRALANLVGNAVKFTSAGSVAVVLEASAGWQKVLVRDTGPGIPRHELENIFSKFYRVNRGRHDYPEARQGTGLGLFIARSILEQHGGSLKVESAEGKGSIFTASIPARERAA